MTNKTVKFVRVSGLKALERLQEGGIATTRGGKSIWKIIDDQLHYRCPVEGFTLCHDKLNTFLNPLDKDWFIEELPFNPRKEMFERPNEWVAKYFVESEQDYYYLGFDSNEMCAVFNRSLEPRVTVWSINADIAEGEMLDKAIPLDKDDLKAIKTMRAELYLNKNK